MDFERDLTDKYENITLIGKGGFSKVYLATDKFNKTKVAIKTIQKNNQLNAPILPVEREVDILRKLNHINIPKIHSFIDKHKFQLSYSAQHEIDNLDDKSGDEYEELMEELKDIKNLRKDYITYLPCGNSLLESLNVIDNRISIFSYLIVGILLTIFIGLSITYCRMLKLVKRIGKYGLESISNNNPSLADQFVKSYVSFLDSINKYLNKSVFITKHSNKYNKYLGIVNKHYKDTMNFIAK